MVSGLLSLNVVPLSLDHGLDTASEPGAGPDDQVAGHCGEVLLDGGDQEDLGGVRTSIGVCFKVAPDKIIHWIKITAARRSLFLGDEVVAVLT